MEFFDDARNYVALALGVAAFAFEVFAFFDVITRPAPAFAASGNQTKVTWLAITGVAMAVGMVAVPNVLGLVGILAFVAAAVYVVRVRPAVRGIGGGGSRPPSRNGW